MAVQTLESLQTRKRYMKGVGKTLEGNIYTTILCIDRGKGVISQC